MSNMSYCRFENTNRDLGDCRNALEEIFNGDCSRLSMSELREAKGLIDNCMAILNLFADQLSLDLSDEGAFGTLEDGYEGVLDAANKELSP